MRPEDSLQIAVADYLRIAAPDLLWFHVANERKCSPQRGDMLKLMGVLAGVPDLVFVLPDGHVGFIELKAGKGRLSKAQDEFFERALHIGARCHVARSVDDVESIMRYHLRVKLRAKVVGGLG